MATRILRVPHVVIVGGGFGGLWAARALRRAPVTVTVVDRRNHHIFQPLLYQVATATLSPADIASPIRQVLRKQGSTEVRMAEVTNVDTARKEVVFADGDRMEYDYLIVATGATHAYFGHPEWEPIAPGLKTLEDATEIRRRFLLAFEAAEQEEDPEEQRALLTFVVIGGGPTGVEMAGSMAETARRSIARDFRHIDPARARIMLLEGGPRLLAAYPETLSQYAAEALQLRGVEVRTGSIVTDVQPDHVRVGDEVIRTRNVVWAAGVTASPLGKCLGVPTDRVGRVQVLPDLSVPGHPEVFVIGDLASLDGDDGRPLPGVAQVAMQMGRRAASNIVVSIEGGVREAFHYKDKGSMAVMGRRAAVLHMGRVKMTGALAWWGWLLIHIFFLVGFRNRISVFTQWAWSYVTWQRGARLITGEVGAELAPAGKPLGTPDTDQSRSGQDADAAERQGQTAPADTEATGWMGGDRHQAGGGR
jgi:NADH dehydrogenase